MQSRTPSLGQPSQAVTPFWPEDAADDVDDDDDESNDDDIEGGVSTTAPQWHSSRRLQGHHVCPVAHGRQWELSIVRPMHVRDPSLGQPSHAVKPST